MQRAPWCAGMGLGLMLATSSAHSGEVELSVENRIGVDSNVLRSEEPTDDGTWEFTPRVGIREDGESLVYGLGYQPTYRNFFSTSGIDGVDHYSQANVGWALSSRDRIDATASYYNGRLLRNDTVPGTLNTVNLNDRARLKEASVSLSYRRIVTPRLALGLTGSFDDFDAPTKFGSQTDSRAYTGRASANYDLSPRMEIGVSLSARRRENRAVDTFFPDDGDPLTPVQIFPQPSSNTDVYDVLFSASRIVTPTIRVSAQAGPSFIRQQQFPGQSKQPAPGGSLFSHDESRNVSVFAAATLSKEWKSTDFGFSYIRSESRSGSLNSGSSISDRISVDVNHRFSDELTVRAAGSWNNLAQIVKQQGAQGKSEIAAYQAIGTVEYVLSRRLLLIGQYSYNRQVNDSGLQGGLASFVDIHLGFLGLRYTFEPIAY